MSQATVDALQEYFEELEPFADETFSSIRRALSDVEAMNHRSSLLVTRRRIKTLTSIRDKLIRQTTKLSQMQDIVGCRIVVPYLDVQDQVVASLNCTFPSRTTVYDRRLRPAHGYRAVHVIVRDGRKRFEVQVRTRHQDLWANIVEGFADREGMELKYGGGRQALQDELTALSEQFDNLERTLAGAPSPSDEAVRAVEQIIEGWHTFMQRSKDPAP